MKKFVCLLTALVFAATMFAGCGSQGSAESDDGKIQIKVQYLCGRMNLDLESVLEDRFPNVDIVTDELVGDPDYIIAKEMEHNIAKITDGINSVLLEKEISTRKKLLSQRKN